MTKLKRILSLLFLGLLVVLANDICLALQLSYKQMSLCFFIISSVFGYIIFLLFKKQLNWDEIPWYLFFPLAFMIFMLVARLELWFIGVFMFIFIVLGIAFPKASKSLRPYVLGFSILLMGTLFLIAPSFSLKQGKKISKSVSLSQVKYVTENSKDSLLMNNLFTKATILVSWNANCGACKREINEVVNELCVRNSKDVQAFAINMRDDCQKASTFQSKFCPTIICSKSFLGALGVNGVPSLLLLSADGKIVYAHHGYVSSLKDDLMAEAQGEIDKLRN